MNVYPFIEAEKRGSRNVTRACALLKVSRAAFYAWLSGPPSGRDQDDADLAAKIAAVHEESRGRYGARGCMLSCAAAGTGTAASGSPG